MARPARPWLAALLSLLASPGLGQLYGGRALKAAAFLFGAPPAGFLLLWLMTRLPGPPLNIGLPLLALLGVQVWISLDAARAARSSGDRPRPWYSRWYVLVLVWALNAFLLVPAWTALVISSCLQAFQIPSGGMERTVVAGDHLLVDKSAFGVRLPFFSSTILGRREPQRGDLVVFLFPEDRQRVFLKRSIGLPGETIEVRGKTVYADGKPLAEPYAHFLDREDEERGDWGPEQVPAGHLFVLGDSRDNSRDSRFWGFVPVSDVLGIAKMVYFSWDEREERVRWERIGQALH